MDLHLGPFVHLKDRNLDSYLYQFRAHLTHSDAGDCEVLVGVVHGLGC